MSTLHVTGGCLCGVVRYEVRGPLAPAHACYCTLCRRQSGHYVACTSARRSDFVLIEDRGLKWYRSSPSAKRGFCAVCGSALFWDDGSDYIGLNVGNMDAPTGLTLEQHIFVDEKGDYYEVTDDLPKFARYDEPVS